MCARWKQTGRQEGSSGRLLAEAAMSNSHLPPETLDYTIDSLYDELEALKERRLAPRSWVPRARKHLFSNIELLPDPSNSPAYHPYPVCSVDSRGRRGGCLGVLPDSNLSSRCAVAVDSPNSM